MGNEEREQQESRGFKVADRRRFTPEGDLRETADDVETPSEPPAEDSKAAEATPAANEGRPAGADEHAHQPPPFEMSFSTFLISLSTQALVHLGEIPDPMSQQQRTDLGAAKQLIDIIGILQTKTVGNLDEGEAGLIENVLYDLRLKYVERAKAPSGA